jgi:hypothetical protein
VVYPLYFRYQQPWVQTPFNLDCLFSTRTPAALFLCRFVFGADSRPFLFKKNVLHNIKVHNACHPGRYACGHRLRSPSAHSAILTTKVPGQSIHPLVGWGITVQCWHLGFSDIPLSARGSALHCSIGDIFKTQRGIPYQPGYGRGYSGKPRTRTGSQWPAGDNKGSARGSAVDGV